MATQVYQFAPVIPAGTPISAPVTINLTMPARIVRTIEVRVPPGPSGVMGFAFAAAGQSVIPTNAGGWVVTDDELLSWDLDEQLQSGAWQIKGYNTGTFPHTVYVRFLTDLPGAVIDTPQAPTLIPADQIAPLTADDLAALTNVPAGTFTDADLQAALAAGVDTDGAS